MAWAASASREIWVLKCAKFCRQLRGETLGVTFLHKNMTPAGSRGCAKGLNISLHQQRANIDPAKTPWGKQAAQAGGYVSPGPVSPNEVLR